MMKTQPQTVKKNYDKILVAIEHHPEEKQDSNHLGVLAQAIEIAKKNNSHLFIFHSITHLPERQDVLASSYVTPYAGLYVGETLSFSERIAEEAIEELNVWLRSIQTYAEQQGVQADYEYGIGEPGKLICDRAEEHDIDLIIIGRRGLSGLSEMFLGSVSNYVVHHAPCHVLVVQH